MAVGLVVGVFVVLVCLVLVCAGCFDDLYSRPGSPGEAMSRPQHGTITWYLDIHEIGGVTAADRLDVPARRLAVYVLPPDMTIVSNMIPRLFFKYAIYTSRSKQARNQHFQRIVDARDAIVAGCCTVRRRPRIIGKPRAFGGAYRPRAVLLSQRDHAIVEPLSMALKKLGIDALVASPALEEAIMRSVQAVDSFASRFEVSDTELLEEQYEAASMSVGDASDEAARTSAMDRHRGATMRPVRQGASSSDADNAASGEHDEADGGASHQARRRQGGSGDEVLRLMG